jgi:probable F420-dependent oxidoreductase
MQFGIDIGELNLSIAWASDRSVVPRPGRPIKTVVDDFFQAARLADSLGFDSVWLGDHMIFPEVVDYERSYYTGTPSGRNAGVSHTQSNLMDVLTQLASLTGVTSHVKLGTKVLVLPIRHPLLTAKILATLDALSGGRVILGIGVGWLREEFEAFGAASYEHRGSLSDEYIRILREVWTRELPSFDGRWYKFSGFGFQPHPVQTPHIPIWIGGHTEPALRRTARLGNGWYPTAIPPQAYSALVERLRILLEANGRQMSEITLAVHMRVTIDLDSNEEELQIMTGPDVSLSFQGGPRQLVAAVRAYAALGVSHVSFDLSMKGRTGTPAGRAEAMEIVAREVIPEFRSASD